MTDALSLLGHFVFYDDSIAADDLPKLRSVASRFPVSFVTVVKNLRKLGITRLFPVQKAILDFLEDVDANRDIQRDISVCAPTGSGKTLAFTLPIAQAVLDRPFRAVRAIVISPSRILAQQTFTFLTSVFADTSVVVAPVLGTLSREQEAASIRPSPLGVCAADVIVATPGRLADALAAAGTSLASLNIIVADETDRILGATFSNCITAVAAAAGSSHSTAASLLRRPRPLRKIALSATLTTDPGRISLLQLVAPALIAPKTLQTKHEAAAAAAAAAAEETVGEAGELRQGGPKVAPVVLPATLTEAVVVASTEMKLLYLYLILIGQIKLTSEVALPCLVFMNTKEQVQNLTDIFTVLSNQEIRTRAKVAPAPAPAAGAGTPAITSLGKGVDIAVVTDGAARGVDLDIPLVVAAQVPRHANTYVHRAGRTARAGRVGTALTVAGGDEAFSLKQVIRAIHPGQSHRKAVSEWKEVGGREELESSHPQWLKAWDLAFEVVAKAPQRKGLRDLSVQALKNILSEME